jgi:hypothetical protein
MMSMKRNGVIVAAIVAGLFTGASYADDMSMSSTAAVHCMGVNSCKGMSSCKTSANSCKGMNSCKGKGVVANLTAKQCSDKGGTVVQ